MLVKLNEKIKQKTKLQNFLNFFNIFSWNLVLKIEFFLSSFSSKFNNKLNFQKPELNRN